MISFRKCEVCGRALEGPEAEQQVVEHRRFDPAAEAVLQREIPRDLPPEAVCAECLEEYRLATGRIAPPDDPSD